MSSQIDNRAIKKALNKVNNSAKSNRSLKKRSEDYQVFQDVFNKPTLITLYSLFNNGTLSYLNGIVNSGKESNIFWGVTPDGNDVAIKIYLTVASEFRKRLQYIEGDHRFKNINTHGHKLIELWARKEFKNLSKAYSANLPVPKPIAVKQNVLVMDFLGIDGAPYPTLSETEVEESDFEELLKLIKQLYQQSNLIHSDLSEYNVFKNSNDLILFDFGSAVDVSHPMSKDFLLRDLINICKFFSKRGITTLDAENIFKEITENDV
ncbi:MAG: serine/threonine protein kinase [Thaumarchaeota archaeon]|nr:serine/threonine protein kinase [Nitrososphaerota archaeon]|tara:strand:+ start:3186 stop:3977 length:792 start_codon:yes stop_codon:yes gene_type:complete